MILNFESISLQKQMRIGETRECTECFFEQIPSQAIVAYAKRLITSPQQFPQQIFHSQDRFDHDQIQNALFHFQVSLNQENSEGCKLNLSSSIKKTTSYKDKINKKRQFIKQVILNQGSSNIAHIARFTKSSREAVKSVMQEVRAFGDVSHFEYNNLKSPQEEEALHKTIDQIEDGYKTVGCIKRLHPSFSRKKILKHLHERGYRYRLMRKELKEPDPHKPSSTRICRVVSHIAQAISDPNTTLLYIDEMKFPLVQTAERQWMHKDTLREDALIYNRRDAPETTLTAIALCSLQKFEAVQIYKGEITGKDFLHFLVEAISRLPPRRQYTIIADNATWHHAGTVTKSAAGKYLFFNEPKMFQLNVIENAFSFVRHAFRIRSTVDKLEEEARNIINIFFEEGNKKRFKGYFRQHLRNLQDFLQIHKPK